MKDTTRTLIMLHTAVFLAGWTGIFGRLIALSGLPLVWYRMLVSVATLLLFLVFARRLHKVARPALLRIGACGILLALHWVFFYLSIQASNVSVGSQAAHHSLPTISTGHVPRILRDTSHSRSMRRITTGRTGRSSSHLKANPIRTKTAG